MKSYWAWSYTFENKNKRNAFLRFILKENGSNSIKRKFNVEKAMFHNFPCIRKLEKRAWPGGGVKRSNFDSKFFLVFLEVQEQLMITDS